MNIENLSEQDKQCIVSLLNKYPAEHPLATKANLKYFAVDFVREMLKKHIGEATDKTFVRQLIAKIEYNKWYVRGRDYPPYDKNGIKMSMTMSGKELKKWFSEIELKEYPKPDAYTGSLP